MKFLLILISIVHFSYAEKCEYNYFDNQNIVINTTDKFGCEYDNRDLKNFRQNGLDLAFNLDETEDSGLILKSFVNSEYRPFDKYEYSAPETDKVRFVVYIKTKQIVAISHGVYSYIEEEGGITGIAAVFYTIDIYKNYNGFLLKINLSKKVETTLHGMEGFYNGNSVKFLYKTKLPLIKKINNLYISNKMILVSLENFSKNKDNSFDIKNSSLNLNGLKNILKEIKISKNTLVNYNNIAYYLEKAKAYPEAIYLLEKILEKYPNRTVAYINLGDAYWGLANKEKAKQAYSTYIKQMKEKGKERKIPKVVLERIK
ncbi:tetratricopeptide repeat protein [Sulfurimonas sp.]|uniref:tetratricopeptide repeat protein n=1 Tax=Sulfurimonas sp. TaxID=2022749 RepID=UPI002B4A9629|nr:tetratricopeptide repeat protein [Sulfurimonas sp.]